MQKAIQKQLGFEEQLALFVAVISRPTTSGGRDEANGGRGRRFRGGDQLGTFNDGILIGMNPFFEVRRKDDDGTEWEQHNSIGDFDRDFLLEAGRNKMKILGGGGRVQFD